MVMPLPYRIVALQALVGLVLVLGALAWDGREAVAALAATIVSVVPNGYFAWRVSRERAAARVLAAEVVKITATVGLMGLAFATMELRPLGFFATFGALQLAHVVGGASLARNATSR
jgi:F0F1-type ATP synthase assembly protein I